MADLLHTTAANAISRALQPPSAFTKRLVDQTPTADLTEGGGCGQKWYPLQDGVVAVTTGWSAYGAKVRTSLLDVVNEHENNDAADDGTGSK